jgi:asparagine synthase (glutamine-hydrolysing)
MPKGLHALRGLDRRPDLETVARHVALLPRAGEASFFASIQRVEPGHLVTIRQDGRVVRRRHWHPERRDLGLRTFEDYVESFRAHLDEAVRSRLRGCDGDIATHLSGGWDSSAVTATAARLLGNRRVLAFTSVPNRRREVHAPKSRFR